MSYTLTINNALLKELLDAGYFHNNDGHRGTDLLKQAIHNNDLDMVVFLLDHNCSPNHVGLACELKNLDLVKILLNKGADPNIEYKDEYPLIIAIEKRQLDIVQLLVDHGAKLYVGNGDPLRTAIKTHDKELIKFLLLSSPLDIRQEIFRWLIWNRKFVTCDLLELFLEHDRDAIINVANWDGNTMLHEFARVASLPMVVFLLKHGANLNVINKDGLTPKQMVESQQNDSRPQVQIIIEVFESYETPIKDPGDQ